MGTGNGLDDLSVLMCRPGETMMDVRSTDKARHINNLHASHGSMSGQALKALILMYIEDIREENDTVDKDHLNFNQGKISAYRQILNDLEYGLTTTPRRS